MSLSLSALICRPVSDHDCPTLRSPLPNRSISSYGGPLHDPDTSPSFPFIVLRLPSRASSLSRFSSRSLEVVFSLPFYNFPKLNNILRSKLSGNTPFLVIWFCRPQCRLFLKLLVSRRFGPLPSLEFRRTDFSKPAQKFLQNHPSSYSSTLVTNQSPTPYFSIVTSST